MPRIDSFALAALTQRAADDSRGRASAPPVTVLNVLHYPVFGGPHNQAARLHGPLLGRGFRTVVIVPDETGNAAERLRAAGVEVLQLKLGRLRATSSLTTQVRWLAGFMGDVSRLRAVIRSTRADVVQVGGLVNIQGGIAARLEGVPVVWQLLDTRAPRPVAFAAMIFVDRLADVVMSTGIRVALAHPLAARVKNRLVPYFPPVQIDAFTTSSEIRDQVRQDWGIPASTCVIGAVGNINPQKGYETLIRAAALGRHSRERPITVVIVGASHETHREYEQSLYSLARHVGLQVGEDIRFMGERADVHRLVHGFDIFALSSVRRSEGVPTAMLEAMTAGLPIVATDVGGVADAVTNGLTGLLVPAGDPVAFASALAVLVDDPDLGSKLGHKGAQTAAERFSVDVCADVHESTYRLARAGRDSVPRPSGSLQGDA